METIAARLHVKIWPWRSVHRRHISIEHGRPKWMRFGGNLVWKVQSALGVKTPILDSHLDLIRTGWEIRGLGGRVSEQVKARQSGEDTGAGCSKGMIVEPKGPWFLGILIKVDGSAWAGATKRSVIWAGPAVGREPGIRSAIGGCGS